MDFETPSPPDPVKAALDEWVASISVTENFPSLMTIRQAAIFVQVHPSTVRRWVSSGRLAAVRPSPHIVRIRRSSLLDLINNHTS